MKFIYLIALLFLYAYAYADTDGRICITEDQIYLEAKNNYFKISENDKHSISFKDGNIKYSKKKKNISKNCLKPFPEQQNTILFKNSKHIISLVVSWNSQGITDEYGTSIFHHFMARVVKNSITGDFIESLILGETTKLETVD